MRARSGPRDPEPSRKRSVAHRPRRLIRSAARRLSGPPPAPPAPPGRRRLWAASAVVLDDRGTTPVRASCQVRGRFLSVGSFPNCMRKSHSRAWGAGAGACSRLDAGRGGMNRIRGEGEASSGLEGWEERQEATQLQASRREMACVAPAAQRDPGQQRAPHATLSGPPRPAPEVASALERGPEWLLGRSLRCLRDLLRGQCSMGTIRCRESSRVAPESPAKTQAGFLRAWSLWVVGYRQNQLAELS